MGLFGKTYRAIVVHSSAHDKRRHKRIDRTIEDDYKKLEKLCKTATATPFFCEKDAKVASEKLVRSAVLSYHTVVTDIMEVPKYGRGRPVIDQPRTITSFHHDSQGSGKNRVVKQKSRVLCSDYKHYRQRNMAFR